MKKWREIPLTVKVSVSYVVCSVLQRCISFITMPLFTRLLSTEQYGQYVVYQSWMGFLSIFLTLNLAYGSFSTAMVKFDRHREEYISSLEGICLVLSTIFLVIYLPFRFYWNKLFQLPTYMVLLLVVEIICSNALLFWSGKKRFEFKYKSVIGITLVSSVLSPLLALVLVQVMQEKGYARILGYSIIAIVFGGMLFIYNLIKGKKIYTYEYWKYALSFNIPLIAYYLSQMIFNQSDRIMISHLCGGSDAAMYGVAYSLAMILNFVLNAINNSYVPWFYEKIKEGRMEENRSVSCGIAIIMAFLLLGIIWYAPEIIAIMAGKQYGRAVGVVAPVAVSLFLLFYAQLFINVQFYYEEKGLLVWASIGAAVLNIVLNALMIPRFTFVAAGYTTLASYMVFAVCNYLAMKQTLSRNKQKNVAYKPTYLIAIFIGFVFSSLLGVALYNHLVIRGLITAGILVILICQRRHLLGVVSEIRKK